MNYTYEEMHKELPQIKEEYDNGDFDDLLEMFLLKDHVTPNHLRDALLQFTSSPSVYFETLIRFLETKILYLGK